MRNGRLGGLISAAAMLAAALGAGGCGAEIPAQLANAPAAGVAGQVGQIGVRDLFVLGAAPGQSIPVGGAAPVYLNLVDQQPTAETLNPNGAIEEPPGGDVLESVSSPMAKSVRLVGGPIQIPRAQNVQVGPAARVILEGLTQEVSPAKSVPVTLKFRRSGSGTFNAPVLPWDTYWKTFSPAPVQK